MYIKKINMLRYAILLLPVLLFADNKKMHDEDPKNRPHNTLGFGVLGSVYINDDQIFIGQTGSTLNNGSVFIYSKSDDGKINKDQIFPPIVGTVEHDFGFSISVDGNSMIVGAPSRAGNGVGRAYIYQRKASKEWVLKKEIVPDSSTWTTDFGSKVVIENDLILIGDRYARSEDGMVYALYFNKNLGNWIKINPIWTDQIISHGLFGHDIDIYQNRAIIGSRDGNIAIEYLFDSSNLNWVSRQVFSPKKLQSKGRFGFSVKISDSKVFIGYPGYDQKGEVQVFDQGNYQWELKQTIAIDESEEGLFFGASLSINKDQLMIGNFNGEKVFSYRLSDKNSYEQNQIMAPQNLPGSKFGRSISMASEQLLIGATYGEIAYMYHKSDADKWQISEVFSSEKGNQSVTGRFSPCSVGNKDNYYGKGGLADQKYPCSGIDLYAFITASDLGGNELNDIWGWTDPATGKEIALVGLTNGLSFVDVSDPLNSKVLGILPTQTRTSVWRDVKVYKDHAFIVADNASNHGVQIFDLTQLRGIASFTTFQTTAHYDQLGSAHNIAINEETGFAYVVGSYGCGAHIINIQDPINPKYAGCLTDADTGRGNDGYVHDGQFIVYKGPDTDYYGKEIALTSNETALSIADVTDKSNLKLITNYKTNYSGSRYIHQGWITDDHKYFYVNDELNERNGIDTYQTTFVFDITDLDNPKIANYYNSGLRTIDHNIYIVDTLMYQSNYSSGLRVLSIADPINPKEVAYFDTYPSGNRVSFVGSWSNYPYFASKTIVVSSIEEGLFVLKINEGDDLSLDDSINQPVIFNLQQNFPNPFNPSTTIQYTLPHSGEMSLLVYNSLGQIVKVLKEGYQEKGSYNATFNGASFPSGIYFYQLSSKDFIQTRKMSLIK